MVLWLVLWSGGRVNKCNIPTGEIYGMEFSELPAYLQPTGRGSGQMRGPDSPALHHHHHRNPNDDLPKPSIQM